ncbi:MAG: hypothetical protein TREMPRED_001789 [Tremellales sp. Tagirdzhanova-0007]|nr:MAG: hypothetical protein TREMPRED_001789 [Tremellales sp. Tagirdzhanova-0007]
MSDGGIFSFLAALFFFFLWSLVWTVCLLGLRTARIRYAGKQLSSRLSTLATPSVPGVSIIRPLCGLDNNLYNTLEAVMKLEYPNYEVLFSVQDDKDEALPVVKMVMQHYSQVQARVIIDSRLIGVNPKINNLLAPFEQAQHDLLWIIDSTVSVTPGTLGRAVEAFLGTSFSTRSFDSDLESTPLMSDDIRKAPTAGEIGLVHHVPYAVVHQRTWGSMMEQAFLNTTHAKMYLAINSVALDSCVIGKSNLYSRTNIASLTTPSPSLRKTPNPPSGLAGFSPFLAEDNMIALSLWHELCLKHAMSGDVALDFLGALSVRAYINRRVRWIRVRKRMAPVLATMVEPFTESIVCGLYGCWAIDRLLGANRTAIFLAHMVLWLLVDTGVRNALATNVKDGDDDAADLDLRDDELRRGVEREKVPDLGFRGGSVIGPCRLITIARYCYVRLSESQLVLRVPQHQYTSLSSLIHSSPSSSSKQDTYGNKPQRSGWHLPSVEEERTSRRNRSRSKSRNQADGPGKKEKEKGGSMSMWKMMALTVSMGGGQIAWTVELGYGTPFLLSLGLSEQLTSLVWLAGPVSGLVAQPLIGAISDSSSSRFRRRYWIVTATLLLILSGLGLAFTEPIAKSLVDLFGGGQGDWDPRSARLVSVTREAERVPSYAPAGKRNVDWSRGSPVWSLYPSLQASLRNLVLDVTPGEQLAAANAWHGRFNHLGNIVGFTMGYLNLNDVPIIRLVGGGQFRKVCIVALLLMTITVWVTCWTQEEDERENIFGERRSKFSDIVHTIYEAVLHLPKPVRRVCIVQIAAFMGWFPFLFYSTTYVAEVMANELGREPDIDKATRAGSLALLIYSFVAIVAGTVLPYLASRDRRLLKPATEKNVVDEDEDEDEEDGELERIRDMVKQWKAEAARNGRPMKLPTMPFMLRNIWTAGLLLFAAVMASTFFITKVWQATIAIAIVGICWAIACWALHSSSFRLLDALSIIMEFLKEMDDSSKPNQRSNNQRAPNTAPPEHAIHSTVPGLRPLHARAASTPIGPWRSQPNSPARFDERTPLSRSYSTADLETVEESLEYKGSGPVAGGTIMGIHNLAIVFPQFIIAVVASVIFNLADDDSSVTSPSSETGHAGKNGVAWVLRFGGFMALLGALISRKVPPTKTEKAMRRRLAEMREESAE